MSSRWVHLLCMLTVLTAGCSSTAPPDPILGQWILQSDDRIPFALRAVSDDVYIHFFENGKCIFAVPVPMTKNEITVKGTWKAGDQDNIRVAEFRIKNGEREVEIKMLDSDTIELTPPTTIKIPVKFARAPTPATTKE
jgi:hypothetical protein